MGVENKTIKFLPHQLATYKSKKAIAGIVGGRGSGKTYFLSILAVLSFLQGERVMVWSQTFRSLKLNLFDEIEHRLKEFGLEYKYNRIEMMITMDGCKGVIYGYSYEGVDACRGATCISLVLLDEIALAPPNLLSVIVPCQRGAGITPRLRFGTSPRKGSYWNLYFQEGLRNGNIDIFTAKMTDNTFLSEESIKMSMDAIQNEEQRRQELYGEILGGNSEFSIIQDEDYPSVEHIRQGDVRIGCDFSGSVGRDSNVFVVADDSGIIEIVESKFGDTFSKATIITNLYNKYKAKNVFLDGTGGFSSGVSDVLKARGVPHLEVNFAQKAKNDKTYTNFRANAYFNLVKRIRNGFFIDKLKYPQLVLELNSTEYYINDNGKTALVSKEEIKLKIGHSPDTADALILCFADDAIIANNQGVYHDAGYYKNIIKNIR